jgi:pyrrolidone-carboxylate peptidase
VTVNNRLVIGAFRPFGGKSTNNAEAVSNKLKAKHEAGELAVPEGTDVHFVPMTTDQKGVADFVQTAQDLQADKVLMLGESGFSTKIESRAIDRTAPGTLFGSAARTLIPSFQEEGSIESQAPVDTMAEASGSSVSQDPGHYYCNYAYHQALQVGLNACFVHVPSGLFGVGKQTEQASKQVEEALTTWYVADDKSSR